MIVEIYLCTGGYYARLICSVPPVVQGSYPEVCSVVMGCLTGCHDVMDDDGHIWPKHVVLI